ncbi:MAG TPA: family 20 glycosylhydrolase, partial [Phototrophicaceae bacterium]|nr:family 20 glycosylhydrolase [Phototrophicaceae bacterium]
AHAGGMPAALTIALDESLDHPQGYHLSITKDGTTLTGRDAAGVFYGCCTLHQLVEVYGGELPCMVVDDYPDFLARGVMLDISRDKVPTMDTLYLLIRKLAFWKINQVQLYTEHTFAYRDHQEVWAESSPLTGQEVLELDVYCRQHHIDLVPNQNSLGHMERWLKFDRYRPLAECPDGFQSHWGVFSKPTTLDPQDPGSLQLITSLYDELLPHFTSSQFNVGGDEPWELGQGKSKAAVEAGGGRVYLEYLKKLYQDVSRRGLQMQFWGDIIIHYPELVPELPKDMVAMEWGYEGTHDFDGHCKLFADAGVPFYVCPGSSSWNALVGRTANMIENNANAAINGMKHGAIGYLNTDWGDNGHWQPLSVSYAGFAVGAAFSWCYTSNQGLDLPTILDTFVFRDRAGHMGQLVYDLGNVYKITGQEHINGQVLATTLQRTPEELDKYFNLVSSWGGEEPNVDPETLRQAVEQVNEILSTLNLTEMQLLDSSIIRSEFRLAGDLLLYSAYRLMHLQGAKDWSEERLATERAELKARQHEVWLLRNRPGGLEDSLNRWAD